MRRGANTTVLGGIADIKRSHANAVVSQYDIAPMVEIFATVQGRDLGAVSSDIRDIMASHEKSKPKGSTIALVGQTATMHSAYTGLAIWPARRHRPDLFADRNKFPVLDRSVRDHHGAAGCARRHRLDAVRDRTRPCRYRPSPARSCAWAWRRPTACS